MIVDVLRSRRRWLARSHPFWMYVSRPSGRTSVSVTWMSVSVALDDSQRSMLLGPAIVTSSGRGGVDQASAVPPTSGSHVYGGMIAHDSSEPLPGSDCRGRTSGSGLYDCVPTFCRSLICERLPS